MSGAHDELVRRALAELEVLMSYRRRNVCDRPATRDISIPQFHALVVLHERGARTVTDLAHHLGISAPSASSIVDRMEEHGYVVRERDAIDRRVVNVSISDEGRSVVEEMMGVRRDHSRRLLNAMTDDELNAVLSCVDAVKSAQGRLEEASLEDAS
jgi:DNA-binding MarR family transcriptional regulator